MTISYGNRVRKKCSICTSKSLSFRLKKSPNKKTHTKQTKNEQGNKKPQTELFLIPSDISDTDVILLLRLCICVCIVPICNYMVSQDQDLTKQTEFQRTLTLLVLDMHLKYLTVA